MTDVISRPILRVKTPSEPAGHSVALSAAAASAAAGGVGIVACVAVAVIAWFSAESGSFAGAVRVGALAWLLANGGGLHLAGAAVTAIPLGACLVVGWIVYRGGRWVGARARVRALSDVAAGAGVMGAVYGATALTAYAVTRSADVHADAMRAAVGAGSLGLVFGGLGILRGAGMTPVLLGGLPVQHRAILRGAAAGVAVMLLAGTLLVAASLGLHLTTAVALAERAHPGVVGGAVLALIVLSAVPNAVLCAGAFAAGPGFAVGTGTAVAPGGIRMGPAPSFPLLAAVPHDAAAWWMQALAVVPVAAGVVAGLTAARTRPATRLDGAAVRGGLAGLSGGVAFGVITSLGGGAVGPGRMQDVGPDVVGTLVVCAAAGALGGALAAAGLTWLSDARARRRPAAGSDPHA